jgi:hypothetical protein
MPNVDEDPEQPSAEPPAGADPLIWRLAFGLHRDHRPHNDGFCQTCRAYWPCAPHNLARLGFVAAVRSPGASRAGRAGNSGTHY